MRACGLIVEYNPFHNGHQYHIEQARTQSQADCIIAVMSGNFLQRGEPAIIDKYNRAKAALTSGVDILLELPFAYAVQSSHYFAKGAIHTLNEIGVSSLCFGSEQGTIADFITAYHIQSKHAGNYHATIKKYLAKGLSYPTASAKAIQSFAPNDLQIDLTKPNNILGFSYVNRVLKDNLPIDLLTIKRIDSDYHDDTIKGTIASATSIRKQLLSNASFSEEVNRSLPNPSINALKNYRHTATLWHDWENYFPLLKYRVLTMAANELASIHHVDEGLEHRIIQSVKQATSFNHWMQLIKTKRYTWTRLQRMFVHILTNTKKTHIKQIHEQATVPYIRLLGFTTNGRKYLNHVKKQLNIPLISQVSQLDHLCLKLDEKASDAYYTVLPIKQQLTHQQKELQGPLIFS